MENGQKYSAPYLPFKTFLTGLDHLATITIPRKIELSTFYDMSGHNRAQMLSALKFFKLVDKDGTPESSLSELAHNKDERKELIRKLLETFYSDIIAEDLSTTTPSQLDKALDGAAYNVSGETKKKAKTFLLNAATFAGYKPHHLLTKITRNRRKGAAKQAAAGSGKAAQTDTNSNADTDAPPPPPRQGEPEGTKKTIQLRRGGSLTLSLAVNILELKGEDRAFVFELIDRLEEYEQATAEPAEPTRTEERPFKLNIGTTEATQ
jgi:hypothetical protein